MSIRVDYKHKNLPFRLRVYAEKMSHQYTPEIDDCMQGVSWGILMSEWYSVSQGDDALGTEQQVITPNRGHNGRCKYDSTAKSKAQNTTNHFSLIYILQALVFIYPDDIYDLFASILLRNGQWARPSLNFSLFRIFIF